MSDGTAHPDAFVFGAAHPAVVDAVKPPTIDDARRERDEGLSRVEAAADARWTAYAYAWACSYLRTHREWFPDESWSLGLVEPREARAFGPVVLRLIRNGFISRTGEQRQRTRGHAATGPVWRSTVYVEGATWNPPTFSGSE